MKTILLFWIPGMWEWAIIAAFVLFLFFFPKKIPEIIKGVGKGVREFKQALKAPKKEAEDSDKGTSQNNEK